MGWEKRTEVELREEFVLKALARVIPFNQLCAAYGISRKTGYKWLKRYKAEGRAGLANRSRAPKSSPHETAQEIQDAVLALSKKHESWGAMKIRDRLETVHPDQEWPAVSTIHGILERNGETQARVVKRKRKQAAAPVIDTETPNHVWCVDYKGEFKTRDGKYCYPLTCLDHATRYALGCDAKPSVGHEWTQPSFERLFDTFGVPLAILSDNGVPFAHPSSTCRLSRLNVWWIKLGIQLKRSLPGHPQHNARIERFHRTLKQETARPPEADMAAQQQRFDAFLDEYNNLRPHQALEGKTPATYYTPSERPARLRETEYPGYFEVRKVAKAGYIKLSNVRYFVSGTLAREHVGLEEVDDGIWNIYFQDHYIGVIDDNKGQMTEIGPTPVPINVLPMSSQKV